MILIQSDGADVAVYPVTDGHRTRYALLVDGDVKLTCRTASSALVMAVDVIEGRACDRIQQA